MSQEDALAMSTELICENKRQERLTRMLYQKAGVETRHTVVPWQSAYAWKKQESPTESLSGPSTADRMDLYREHAGPLAHRATVVALADAQVDASKITHLITVSCTGFCAPGVDLELIRSLGLPPTTERVHVGYMGCHGAINGLRVAEALAARHPEACILLCAVELCSLHYRLSWDAEGVKGNALFADGSAAIVGGSHRSKRPALGQVEQTGSCVLPKSFAEMSWEIGNHGFEMRMTRQVPDVVGAHLKEWMSAWLDQLGYGIHDIAHWAVHPGGPRILDSVESALELSPNACNVSRDILKRFGNMSSPTVLFILDEILRSSPDFPIVTLAFGPGLTAEVACWNASNF